MVKERIGCGINSGRIINGMCQSCYDKKRYKENKSKIKIRGQEYYEKNRDKIKIRQKKYRENNKDKIKIWYEKYKEEYPEKIKASKKKSYEKNSEKELIRIIKWQKENPERNKNNQRRWRKENPDKVKISKRKYYKNNLDKIRAYDKKYRKDNHEKNKYRLRMWQKENPHKIKKYNSNPNVNISNRIRGRLRRALKLYTSQGKIKSTDKYGIDYKAIIEHLTPFPIDKHLYHIDHIRPLCSFNFINNDGSQNLEEIKKAFAPKNHQWLLAEDNISKGGKWDNKKIKCNWTKV